MRENADKNAASNDAAMWETYHSAASSAVRLLHRLKQTVVCKMFASPRRAHRGRELELDADRLGRPAAVRPRVLGPVELEIDAGQVGDVR